MTKVAIFNGRLNSGIFSKESTNYIVENFSEDIYKLERHDQKLIYVIEHFEKGSGWGLVDIYSDKYYLSEFEGKESVGLSSGIDWVYIKGNK